MCVRMLFCLGEYMEQKLRYFSAGEWCLWGGSVLLIILSNLLFGGSGILTLIASLLGVTSLVFAAKGNPAGPALMILFGVLYGYISWTFRYYGEMLTYLGMTAPMAAVSLRTWMRNPDAGGRVSVRHRLTRRLRAGLLLLTPAVTAVFGLLLMLLHTAQLPVSILSVATSFAAAYLTACRSPYFALAYAANDAVLLVLWVAAAQTDRSCIPMVTCFICFLLNDLYGFLSWKQHGRRHASV